MSIIIDTMAHRLHIFLAYALQTGCVEEEKDLFWMELQDHVSMCPQVDFVVVGGDLHGHVGCIQDGYSCHRGNGYGTRNVDRHQILDFAEANNFIISNTFVKKHTSHLITYSSGDHTSQIDFILV